MTTGAETSPGAARPLVPDDAVLVLFGVTGDLAKRKLLPRLFHLEVAGFRRRRDRHRPPLTGSAHAIGEGSH